MCCRDMTFGLVAHLDPHTRRLVWVRPSELPTTCVIYCEDCQTWLNGPQQWKDHRIGRKHGNRRRKQRRRLKGILRCVCKSMAGHTNIEENIVELCRLAR